jgi:hypothetical protein
MIIKVKRKIGLRFIMIEMTEIDLAGYVFTDGYVVHRIPSGNDSTKNAKRKGLNYCGQIMMLKMVFYI